MSTARHGIFFTLCKLRCSIFMLSKIPDPSEKTREVGFFCFFLKVALFFALGFRYASVLTAHSSPIT